MVADATRRAEDRQGTYEAYNNLARYFEEVSPFLQPQHHLGILTRICGPVELGVTGRCCILSRQMNGCYVLS